MSAEPRVLYELGDLLVVDKPAGMAVHRAQDRSIPHLIGWARSHLAASRSFAAIHRLDRVTSGLVLCSEQTETRAEVARWFAEGQIQKEYLALTFGRTHKGGRVERKLKDDRRGGQYLAAVTRFRRLAVFPVCGVGLSYLSVTPETGRKHQIRRHLRGLGHAIVGDARYSNKPTPAVPGFPGRVWLHAHRLVLPDGTALESPLPPALAAHLELLSGLGDPSEAAE